ncbi:hypothetical protein P152DRAFT_471543 [Eremomyces bilateralis CBS 781.70]|uniref:Uncharacterized protein n=1 Tax=Eremomyces bilateralis CBS 781.70 TaxID=1392243 RepID=A0A6G1GA31_9PEZI|nr:uncharacterized protein P152DRAFT_471543 [Eremomyces bilateralis CBS 781.70]KAF1814884.1 hypothetical protein P152DRAFT_471543 [Eremomyces bilateralis CBS 781.70]
MEGLSGNLKEKFTELTPVILDYRLWNDLDELLYVIEPISMFLRETEVSRKQDIGSVISKWDTVKAHLDLQFSNINALPMAASVENKWLTRKEKQITADLHRVAFHLNPLNRKVHVTSKDRKLIEDFIMKYSGNSTIANQAIRIFTQYKDSMSSFHRNKRLIAEENDTLEYWSTASAFHHAAPLTAIVNRVFTAPANSVPSERAFCHRISVFY